MSAVDVVCSAKLVASYLEIKCPLLDDASDVIHNNFDHLKGDSKFQSLNNYGFGPACARTIRRIPWNKVKNVTDFECFCLDRRHDMMQNSNKQSSVKVTHKSK